MNIFVLDTNPYLASTYHNDKHVVKMILESAQMLVTEYSKSYIVGTEYEPYILHKRYLKHPCVQWIAEDKANACWLARLMFSLCSEYRQRYGKRHKLVDLSTRLYWHYRTLAEPQNFALAMPEEWKPFYFSTRATPEQAVQAYRKYYYFDKQHLATWKSPRVKPSWFDPKHLTLAPLCETLTDCSLD